MLLYEKELSRKLEDKTHELLHVLEEKAGCLLRELSGVDKFTLTKLRSIMDDYYNAENQLSEYVQKYKHDLTVAQGTISHEFEKMKSDIETETTTAEAVFTADLAKIRSDFERQLMTYCESYLMEDYTREVITRIAEESEPYSVVQTTGESTTQVMSQGAVTRELNQLSEEIADIGLPTISISGDGIDFNACITAGRFTVTANNTVNNPLNYKCILQVRTTGKNVKRYIQDVYSLPDQTPVKHYYRFGGTGSSPTWTEWVEDVTSANLESKYNTLNNKQYQQSISTDGTDFNTCTSAGWFVVTANTTVNNPLGDKCILNVVNLGVNSKRYIQHVYSLPDAKTQKHYYRTGRGASNLIWNEWREDVTSDNFADYLSSQKWGAGKTIVNMGDSIFGLWTNETISGQLAGMSGATVYNCAFGGTMVVPRQNDSIRAPFDFANLVSAICSGDWTSQEAQITNEEISGGIFPTRLNTLKSVDFNEVDILTIAYGTNDWAWGYYGLSLANPLKSDTGTSIIKTLRDGITTINSAYPHIKIILITPIWRWWYGNDSDTKSYGSGTLEEFVTEYEILAKELKIPFLDSYHNLAFNENNRSVFYNETGETSTHLNETGRKLYAELINGKLKTLY